MSKKKQEKENKLNSGDTISAIDGMVSGVESTALSQSFDFVDKLMGKKGKDDSKPHVEDKKEDFKNKNSILTNEDNINKQIELSKENDLKIAQQQDLNEHSIQEKIRKKDRDEDNKIEIKKKESTLAISEKMSKEEKTNFKEAIEESELPLKAKDYLSDKVEKDHFKNARDFFDVVVGVNRKNEGLESLVNCLSMKGIFRTDEQKETSQKQDLKRQIDTSRRDFGEPDLFEQFKPNPKKPNPYNS